MSETLKWRSLYHMYYCKLWWLCSSSHGCCEAVGGVCPLRSVDSSRRQRVILFKNLNEFHSACARTRLLSLCVDRPPFRSFRTCSGEGGQCSSPGDCCTGTCGSGTCTDSGKGRTPAENGLIKASIDRSEAPAANSAPATAARSQACLTKSFPHLPRGAARSRQSNRLLHL